MTTESARGTVGLIFNTDLTYLLMVEKKRGPAKMAGKLNGPGGKCMVVDGVVEAPLDCQIRETQEETGLHLVDWTRLCKKHYEPEHTGTGQGFEVHYFATSVYMGILFTAKTMTDEKVVLVSLKDLWDRPHVEDLKQIVPLAISELELLRKVKKRSK